MKKDTIYGSQIRAIKNFPYSKKNPYDIAYLSLVTSIEFAESMMDARDLYPDDKLLQSVCEEELMTTNLQFKHYSKRGHHMHFLYDFFVTYGLFSKVSPQAIETGKNYLTTNREELPLHRAMTIFSREVELPSIFQIILESHKWPDDLDFYEYYLREHIRLDSQKDGHGSRVKDLPQDEGVLLQYYSERYLLYNRGLSDIV